MKYTLLLVLALAVAVNSHHHGHHRLAEIETPDLTYYHKYEQNHGQKINPNVPLTKHYSNERKLRDQSDKLKDELQKTIQESGFAERNDEHQVVALKNQENRLKSQRTANFRIAHQREQSIKEEINHDEKFKELYQQRLAKNEKRVASALPDQRVALAKLIAFDKERIAVWKNTENKYQGVLENTLGKDLQSGISIEKKVASLQGKIGEIRAKISTLQNRETFKVARISEKLNNIEKVIAQDIALDKKRSGNKFKSYFL